MWQPLMLLLSLVLQMGPCRGQGHGRNCTGGKWPQAGCRSYRGRGTELPRRTLRRPQDAGGLSSACWPDLPRWSPVTGPKRTEDSWILFNFARGIFDCSTTDVRCLYWIKYLADIFDKLQSWVVEWQVRSRQDREHLWGLCHVPGTRHLFLDFLSDGENVVSELSGHIILREGDHSCWKKNTDEYFVCHKTNRVLSCFLNSILPGRALRSPNACWEAWLPTRLLTGVAPGPLRLSSSFMLW